MLNCKDVAARASALIDGDLSFWQGLQVRLHLAKCKGCRRFLGQMRVTQTLTKAADAADGRDDGTMAAILARHQRATPQGD